MDFLLDIQKQQAITQLIAHDKEVFDIAFARGTDVFATVGADGSVRMFDLRSLEHSTIIYESPDMNSLLRLCWNKQDDYYLATISMDSPKVNNNTPSLHPPAPSDCVVTPFLQKAIILDIRVPSLPAAELHGHSACVNSLAWAPHSSCHICTAGDDKQALIWDLSALPKPIEGS